MKQFTKRTALVCGLLCTAILCMGIVFIDTTQNFWRVNSGFVQLVVSNTISTITVSTNTPHGFGWNTNNSARSFVVTGRKPGTNATGNGSSAVTTGTILLEAGAGGDSATNSAAATGGAGGTSRILGGAGGVALNTTSNSTGGAGGQALLTGGAGGTPTAVVSNAIGGAGALVNITGGAGGSPSSGAITSKGGNGGDLNLNGGNPGSGVNTNGGNGGGFFISGAVGGQASGTGIGGIGGSISSGAGNGGLATGTGAGGSGGSVSFGGGNAGASAGGGNAGSAGDSTISGGAGATGATNSNGGNVYLDGGIPASGAVPGNVIVGRGAGVTSRGGLQVGPLLGGSATVTNILGASADLDFPSTPAGVVSDLPITVTGVVSNNCAVSLSVPWQIISANGGLFTTFNSNDTIFVRFVNNNLVTTIDPTPGNFTVVVFRIR